MWIFNNLIQRENVKLCVCASISASFRDVRFIILVNEYKILIVFWSVEKKKILKLPVLPETNRIPWDYSLLNNRWHKWPTIMPFTFFLFYASSVSSTDRKTNVIKGQSDESYLVKWYNFSGGVWGWNFTEIIMRD